MKVKLAKTAGFCMGVRRAMNIVLDAANREKGKLYTYGPLVHNPQAVEMLRQKGVEVLGENPVSNATVILRAHGVAPEERNRIKDAGNVICDATCPHVARAHAILKKEIKEGYRAIIVGDRGHAEVNGLLGYADGKGIVVENIKDLDDLPEMERACVIAQTTQDRRVFQEIVESIKNKVSEVKVFDTICDSTSLRQKEVFELAGEVDAMVIVGGRDSANTRRLYEISLSTGVPSFHIESEDELDWLGLDKYENIGVMAGASTPNWVINKVLDRIKFLLKKRKGRIYRYWEGIGEFMVESTLYLSLGAVSMCYSSLVFQGLKPSATMMFIAFFYVFAVHTFNRYNERLKDEFSDPARTRFFRDYGKALIIGATGASLAALYLSYLLGLTDFILLLFSYLLGIIYTIRIVPERLQPFIKYKRLKDLPGSKDFLVSMAWAWVIVLIPMLNKGVFFSYMSISMLAFVLISVFIRSVVFDILSIEGDRIVGRETIPIIIGPKQTQIMLLILAVMISLFMFLSAFFGLVPGLGYYLVLSPVFVVTCFYIFQKRRMQVSTLFEAVIDSNFILVGVITYFWQL
ncbi:MAG: 4-hydroxy-3-methylbut-2-enyl diphosphate reductase [Nitrospiraceae bacterium]|nr:MAG: 4-hydroxy-3-methylbut-2-enyl diphosphate reductase [Nitrospiraceae bacterium]